MRKLIPLCSVLLLASVQTQANFFDDVLKSVERSAKNTATNMAVEVTANLINDMIIGYTTKQVKSEKEVVEEYEEEHGSLPDNTIASSYETTILPGPSVSPGTEVIIKSIIEVIPGKNASSTTIEERLIIYDNEDNSVVLNSMTKKAGKSSDNGGQFKGEFKFTLPEGLPQGVYPIQSTLLLNGDLSGDQNHDLQLVLWFDESNDGEMYAKMKVIYKEM
jgi:hypothetical protein